MYWFYWYFGRVLKLYIFIVFYSFVRTFYYIFDLLLIKNKIMKTQTTILRTNERRLLITLIILLFCFMASAQDAPRYKIEGSEIVKVEAVKTSTKKEPQRTELTHTTKGIAYPVYRGSKGGYFILRTSKKSGKQYKQYLKVK